MNTVDAGRPGYVGELVIRQTLQAEVVLAEVRLKPVPLAAGVALEVEGVALRGGVGGVPGCDWDQVGVVWRRRLNDTFGP